MLIGGAHREKCSERTAKELTYVIYRKSAIRRSVVALLNCPIPNFMPKLSSRLFILVFPSVSTSKHTDSDP